MRLIDADALIKVLETYKFGAIQNEVERAYIKETVINFVKDAPTAYDVSKVVSELKEKKDDASIEAGKRSVRIGEDEYEEEPYHVGKKHAYGHAIELLRRGGVE